jgi:hypothetical protein
MEFGTEWCFFDPFSFTFKFTREEHMYSDVKILQCRKI